MTATRGRRGLNWRHVLIVAGKETTDTLRDRRTWMAMVIVPLIIIPLMLIAAPSAVSQQVEKVERTIAEVAVVGGDAAGGLTAFLGGYEGLAVVGSSDPEADLADRRIHAILYLPPDFDQAIAAERPAEIEIAFDASDQKSSMAHDRLRMAVGAFAAAVAEQRLVERGIDPAVMRPVVTESRNVAPPAKMGGMFLSMIMPMMIAVWAAMGGMYAAIDGTAGEKERGTLEPLLSAPPSRSSLVVGKFLVVTAMSLVSATVSVLAILVAFAAKPEAITGHLGGEAALVSLPLGSLGLIAVASVGVAAIFAALQLAVSVYARSFREAQTYLSPLAIIIVLPGIFTQFTPAADAPQWVFGVPLLNAIFTYKELLEGIVNWSHLLTMLASSLVVAALCLRFTIALFRREQVLFRT